MIVQLTPTRLPDARVMLAHIEAAAALGAEPGFPEIERGRAHYAHGRTMAAEAKALRSPDQLLADTAAAFHAGKTTAEDVARVAAAIEAAATPTFARLVDRAVSAANDAAVAELAEPGDQWITDVFRPMLDQVLAPLAELAEAIPPDMVDSNADNHRYTLDRPVVEAWTRLVTLHQDATGIHDVADKMRQAAMIPAHHGANAEALRWRHPDRLARPRGRAVLLVDGHRAGAEPGIYTAAELAVADQAA